MSSGSKVSAAGNVTFLAQKQPVDERGRAMYAVARSVVRAQLDQLTQEDLEDLTTWCAIEVGACWPGGLPDW